MRVEFINPFLMSTLNVMSTMAMIELKPSKPQRKENHTAVGDVTGLIGMVAPQLKGSLSITLDEKLALNVMQNMLGEAPPAINDEVTDMVGEITNMVAGGAKRLLGESGYEFDMATPVVVSGKNHSINHPVSDGEVDFNPMFKPYGECNHRILL